METVSPILENPLLIAAILLFLAILPRALRQKEKTALDKTVERFEKEEQKAEIKSDEVKNKLKKPVPLKDGSLAYLKGDLPASQETEEHGGIPPFPEQEDKDKERVKIVKVGVPISHYETAESPPKKKVKLIKQEFSIAPDPNKASSKKVSPDPIKEKQSQHPPKDQKSTWSEDLHVPPISDHEESKDNWIEAEIPGLAVERPVEEKKEDIPVFNAFPKETYRSETEKTQKSPSKEKQGIGVKNLTPETEEKKDPKPEKQAAIEANSPEMEKEISKSKPKEVEIKTSVVSHKDIAIKEAEAEKAESLPSMSGELEKTEGEITAVPPQRDDIKTSPEMAKLKPFLLDLRYLDQEKLEKETPLSYENLSDDMVDVTIARLNDLQVSLENQLKPIPAKAVPRKIMADKGLRKNRTRDPLPDLEGMVNASSGKREVSLEELDSFLFTSTQRKNTE